MSQDITLETLANRKSTDPDRPVENVSLETSELDPEQIALRTAAIDLLDAEKASAFGEDAFRDLLGFGQKVLSHVRASDFGDIDAELDKLSALVKDLSVETMNDRGLIQKIPFLRAFSGGIKSFEKKFGVALEQTAQAESRLGALADQLRADKCAYDALLEEERPLIEAFELDLKAAEQKVQIAYNETLPRLESEALDTEDPQAATLVREFTTKVSGFAGKLGDMQAAKSHLAQIGPQIQAIQANNMQLAEKIGQVTTKILPYWKSQVALAVSMIKEEESLKQKREALKKTKGGVDDYRLSGQGADLNLVDLDAVTRINTNLLSTISDTAMLQRAGRAMRIDSEATLLRLDGKIRQAMISAAAFGEQAVPAEAVIEPPVEESEEAAEELHEDAEAEVIMLGDGTEAQAEGDAGQAEETVWSFEQTDEQAEDGAEQAEETVWPSEEAAEQVEEAAEQTETAVVRAEDAVDYHHRVFDAANDPDANEGQPVWEMPAASPEAESQGEEVPAEPQAGGEDHKDPHQGDPHHGEWH